MLCATSEFAIFLAVSQTTRISNVTVYTTDKCLAVFPSLHARFNPTCPMKHEDAADVAHFAKIFWTDVLLHDFAFPCYGLFSDLLSESFSKLLFLQHVF